MSKLRTENLTLAYDEAPIIEELTVNVRLMAYQMLKQYLVCFSMLGVITVLPF